jgi:hypothetical protein
VLHAHIITVIRQFPSHAVSDALAVSTVACQQAELGEGCLNLIKMHEIVLTKTHLALVLEYASGMKGKPCYCLTWSRCSCVHPSVIHATVSETTACVQCQPSCC